MVIIFLNIKYTLGNFLGKIKKITIDKPVDKL